MRALLRAGRLVASQAALLRQQQSQNARLLIALRQANDTAEQAKDVAAGALEEVVLLRRRVALLEETCPSDIGSLDAG